jgi:MSHA biogenesis protein MshO
MPIASGGNYISAVPDTANNAPVSAAINVSPHAIDFGVAQYVSIGAMSSAELYENPLSRAILSSRTPILLNLSAAKRWQRNSLRRRFYLLNFPQAFCVIANQLRLYENQDATSATVNTSSAYSILADNVALGAPFSLSAGSENNNVNVLFNLTFTQNGESIAFNQSVMIRNVP